MTRRFKCAGIAACLANGEHNAKRSPGDGTDVGGTGWLGKRGHGAVSPCLPCAGAGIVRRPMKSAGGTLRKAAKRSKRINSAGSRPPLPRPCPRFGFHARKLYNPPTTFHARNDDQQHKHEAEQAESIPGTNAGGGSRGYRRPCRSTPRLRPGRSSPSPNPPASASRTPRCLRRQGGHERTGQGRQQSKSPLLYP